jgi:hypothetical protein
MIKLNNNIFFNILIEIIVFNGKTRKKLNKILGNSTFY